MRIRNQYGSFEQFKNEVLGNRVGVVAAVDEMADEIFHSRFDTEFESLWDAQDGDE